MRTILTTGVLACALTWPLAGLAQDLPRFDEDFGFEILGTVDGDGLLVSNGGATFYCEVDEGPDDTFLFLEICVPIIGPKAAAAATTAMMKASQGAEDFASAIDNLPAITLVDAVRRTFVAFDCELSRNIPQETIQRELAGHVADDAGYSGPLTEDILDAVGEKGEDALELMVANGQITLNDSDRIARLIDCP